MNKTFYEWGRRQLRKIEIFDGRMDLDKKPELPERSSIASRLKRAIDAAEERRRKRHL